MYFYFNIIEARLKLARLKVFCYNFFIIGVANINAKSHLTKFRFSDAMKAYKGGNKYINKSEMSLHVFIDLSNVSREAEATDDERTRVKLKTS